MGERKLEEENGHRGCTLIRTQHKALCKIRITCILLVPEKKWNKNKTCDAVFLRLRNDDRGGHYRAEPRNVSKSFSAIGFWESKGEGWTQEVSGRRRH